jgi:hypothetical protein
LREIIDGKEIVTAKGPAALKGELNSFFDSLSKTVSTAKKTKAEPFEKWLPSLGKNKGLLDLKVRIPEGSVLSQPLGRAPSIKTVLDVYKNTRNLEIKDALNTRVLRPAYEKYAAGAKSGKDIDLLGRAATDSAAIKETGEATVAATILSNLKNLDDAERARGAALLGDTLFADLQKLDPKGVAKFMDTIDTVLKETGAIDAMRVVSDSSLQGRFLKLFDIDQATRAAAAAKVSRNISDIPAVTPESTLKAAEKISENVRIEDDIVRSLSEAGYPVDKINLRAGDGREKTLFAIILESLQDVLPTVTKTKLAPDIDDYKHVSKTGVRNTQPGYGQGVGVIPKEPSTYFQFDLFLNLAKTIDNKFFKNGADSPLVLRNLKGNVFKGAKLAAEKERITLAAMKVAEDFYMQRGMALTFDLAGVHTPMRFSQAYAITQKSLMNLNLGDKWLRLAFFNGGSGMAPTQLMEAVSKVVAGGTKDEVLQLLKATIRRSCATLN